MHETHIKIVLYVKIVVLNMCRMVLDDKIWSKLEKLLPAPKGRHGENDRLFLEAICWIIRTGCPWRDLPAELGNWKTQYNRFNRWNQKGHLEAILEALKKRWRSRHPLY